MAVVREDSVKLSFEFDNKQMNKANDAVDDLIDKTQKLGGHKGTGKAEEGFEDAAKAAKKFGDTKLNKLSDGISKITSSVGKFTLAAGKTMAKGLAVGVAAGTTALAALGTAAIKGYAEYEQLVGGVDTLFGSGSQSVEEYTASIGKSVESIKAFQKANGLVVDGIIGPKTTAAIQAQYEKMASGSTSAAKTVLKNANDAYKTAGLSANEYMATVTSFSASLISSLGGDTAKAAEMADQAIIDMSDNANKMGTDIGMIQNAYQGFAKQNYTMLDNLKLGYGGTKEEMQRLLKDAEALTGKKFDISNFADITEAIHAIQVEMGIAGTTAAEASETIQGSALAMKSAWSNFLTGMANEDADFDQLLGNLVDSVITFADNLVPRIQIMLPRLVEGLTQLATSLMSYIPGIFDTLLPTLLESASALMAALIDGFATVAPQAMTMGIDLITNLLTGISQQMPTLVARAQEVIQSLCTGLTENLPAILQAGIDILLQLVSGIAQALPTLAASAGTLIADFTKGIMDNLPSILQTGIDLLFGLIDGLFQALPNLFAAIPQIFNAFIEGIFSINWLQVGWDLIKNILVGVWEGACSLVEGVWGGIKSLFDGGGKDAGAEIDSALATSIDANSYMPETAAAGVATDITSSLSSLSTDAYSYGTETSASLANGISGNTSTALSAAADLRTRVENATATNVVVAVTAEDAALASHSG